MSAGGHCGGTGSSKTPQHDLRRAIHNPMLCTLCGFVYGVMVGNSCMLPSMTKKAGPCIVIATNETERDINRIHNEDNISKVQNAMGVDGKPKWYRVSSG